MATETAPHQVTSNGSRSISAKVTDEHWKHLTVQAATRDLSIASVIREAIEAHLLAQPDLGTEEDPSDKCMSYRAFLAIADLSGVSSELRRD